MSEHEGDGVTYVLFLALAAVLVVGWFVLEDYSERSQARECNNISLKDRPADCQPSADQSRAR